MIIKKTQSEFIKEPLIGTFGFKGYHDTKPQYLWQSVAKIESELNSGIGLATQSPVWSDIRSVKENNINGANAIMYSMTVYALKISENMSFDTPDELLDKLLPRVHEYGKRLSGVDDLSLTFALNSLVSVDFAAWVLYAREKGFNTFDKFIPDYARPAMSEKHDRLGRIPLITYGNGEREIKKLISDGDYLLKVKIGSDPDHDNDYNKMLEFDKERLSLVHDIARDVHSSCTVTGNIAYYLDANSRYPSKEYLFKLLEHADKIGALERIVVLEEPFPEDADIDVSDIPVRVAADESVHDVESVRKHIQMGYTAIALKPIAKTLTMSFRMLAEAHKHKIPCFCADLTVNPIMVEWNKNFACRIASLPGLKVPAFESNGPQNYRNWNEMEKAHPCCGKPFTKIRDGCFILDSEFYGNSGGILLDSPVLNELFE
ncbi:MAG: L-alanine-DL-glutamate epimerase [Clostridiales bacterium]|nr:L-alanine-DL-glutamate epimerase [Clostridiales bacterium]